MLKFLLQKINQSINNRIYYLSKLNPWTNVYGIARSFIALSLLLTLVFNDSSYLFVSKDIQIQGDLFIEMNFFYLFNNISLSIYLAIVILFLVILGYFPQITGFLHWWLCISFLFSSPIIEGGDQLNSIITFLLIPISITDNRLNHWYRKKNTNKSKLKIFAWLIYFLISFQVSVMYFQAGFAKLNVEEWINGTAVYYWATHNIFGVNDIFLQFINFMLSNKYIVVLFTWGTIFIEIIFFGWIFIRRNTWNWLLLFLLGFLFHLGIVFLFGLFSFFFSMLGAITLYYFPKHKNFKFSKKYYDTF